MNMYLYACMQYNVPLLLPAGSSFDNSSPTSYELLGCNCNRIPTETISDSDVVKSGSNSDLLGSGSNSDLLVSGSNSDLLTSGCTSASPSNWTSLVVCKDSRKWGDSEWRFHEIKNPGLYQHYRWVGLYQHYRSVGLYQHYRVERRERLI